MYRYAQGNIHTHTHTHTHIYIYIYVCVCVYIYKVTCQSLMDYRWKQQNNPTCIKTSKTKSATVSVIMLDTIIISIQKKEEEEAKTTCSNGRVYH